MHSFLANDHLKPPPAHVDCQAYRGPDPAIPADTVKASCYNGSACKLQEGRQVANCLIRKHDKVGKLPWLRCAAARRPAAVYRAMSFFRQGKDDEDRKLAMLPPRTYGEPITSFRAFALLFRSLSAKGAIARAGLAGIMVSLDHLSASEFAVGLVSVSGRRRALRVHCIESIPLRSMKTCAAEFGSAQKQRLSSDFNNVPRGTFSRTPIPPPSHIWRLAAVPIS